MLDFIRPPEIHSISKIFSLKSRKADCHRYSVINDGIGESFQERGTLGFDYFQARLSCTTDAFNRLAQWNGLPVSEDGFVPLSIAEFSLYPD
jgi:hypothetical protein